MCQGLTESNLEKRNYNKADYNSINRDIAEAKWINDGAMGVQVSWDNFNENLSKISTTFIPKMKIVAG